MDLKSIQVEAFQAKEVLRAIFHTILFNHIPTPNAPHITHNEPADALLFSGAGVCPSWPPGLRTYL